MSRIIKPYGHYVYAYLRKTGTPYYIGKGIKGRRDGEPTPVLDLDGTQDLVLSPKAVPASHGGRMVVKINCPTVALVTVGKKVGR